MSEELVWENVKEGLARHFEKLNITIIVEKPKTVMIINTDGSLSFDCPSVRVVARTKVAIIHGSSAIREEDVEVPAYTTSAFDRERLNEMINTARERLVSLVSRLIKRFETLNEAASEFDKIEVGAPEHDDP